MIHQLAKGIATYLLKANIILVTIVFLFVIGMRKEGK